MSEQKDNLPALPPISLTDGILPKTLDDVQRFSKICLDSNMMPKSFDTIQKVAIGIMTNMELGRPIITGMQDLAIINGRCGIYGDAALAMVTASGLMAEGYPIEEETGKPYTDDWTFVFKVKRKGGVERVGRFTWVDAKKAGFDAPKTREGRPDRWSPWARFPRRMMQWKSRNWVLRDTFGDVLKGMKTVEDLHDLDGIPTLTPDKEGAYTTEDLTNKIQAGADIKIKSIDGLSDEERAMGARIYEGQLPPEQFKEERVPCPWPDCDCNRLESRWLKPGKGLSKHLTQQHGGQRPPVVMEVEDETPDLPPPDPEEDDQPSQVDSPFPEDDEIPLFNDDGSVNPEAKVDEDPRISMIEKIRQIPPEVKREAYKRVGLDAMNPVLSVYPENVVKEVFEMCRTVAEEFAEGQY